MENEAQSKIELRVAELDKMISEYNAKLCLTPNEKIKQEEVVGYLQMTREQLQGLSAESCIEISYILAQCAAEVQKQMNRENARANWCDGYINFIVADRLNNYATKNSYTSYEEKKAAAIKDNEVTKKLYEIKLSAKTRAESLIGMSYQINTMSKILIDLKDIKMRNKNG